MLCRHLCPDIRWFTYPGMEASKLKMADCFFGSTAFLCLPFQCSSYTNNFIFSMVGDIIIHFILQVYMSMWTPRMAQGRDYRSMPRTVYTVKLVISKTQHKTLTGCVLREGRGQHTMECDRIMIYLGYKILDLLMRYVVCTKDRILGIEDQIFP